MNRARLIRFIRFGLVGCAGFVVDLSIIFAFVQVIQLDPILARIPGWISAVSVTYSFNLLFTFRSTRVRLKGQRRRLRRYGLYVLSQMGGGAVNMLIYACVVSFFRWPWVAGLFLGTLAGMLCNYLGASTVINRKGLH